MRHAAVIDAAADLRDNAADDRRIDLRGVATTRLPVAVERLCSSAAAAIGRQRHRGGDLRANDLLIIEQALLIRLVDERHERDLIALGEQRQNAAQRSRDGCGFNSSATIFCLTVGGSAGWSACSSSG